MTNGRSQRNTRNRTLSGGNAQSLSSNRRGRSGRRGDYSREADSSIQVLEEENYTEDQYEANYSEQINGDKANMNPAEFDEQFEKFITELSIKDNVELQRDDNFSQRGSKSKKGAVIIKEGKMPHHENTKGFDKLDDDYILKQDINVVQDKICHFCKRSMDQHTFIGPFVKSKPE